MPSDCKMLVDTNVLLDYAMANRPEHDQAVKLFEAAAEAPSVQLLVLISSLKDAYYIMRRAYGSESIAREVLQRVSQVFFVTVDLLATYGHAAFDSDEPDFEDGLVRAASESLGVTCIVTRDDSAFARSWVKALTPAKALALIG